jgi:hypothetical protein
VLSYHNSAASYLEATARHALYNPDIRSPVKISLAECELDSCISLLPHEMLALKILLGAMILRRRHDNRRDVRGPIHIQ